MKLLKVFIGIVLAFLLIFLVLRLIWSFGPKTPIQLLLLDKTVVDYEWIEHRSFSWILKHNRYVKPDEEFYSFKEDYYGFIPRRPKRARNYDINRIKITEIENLLSTYSILYIIDAQGVYYNEWYKGGLKSRNKTSVIYGGMGQNDYLLLKGFVEEGKPVICEYNIFGAPTSDLYRRKVEETIDIWWTDWSGKYYNSLNDSRKTDIPEWIITEYKNRNEGEWPYKEAGIILTKGKEDFIVLEEGTHLENSALKLVTDDKYSTTYSLPREIDFTKSFEIVQPGTTNSILANFVLTVNSEGQELLDARRLPSEFPAILINNKKPTYYFAGDFAQNNIAMSSASLVWGKKIGNILGGSSKDFFWQYYEPLISGLLESFRKVEEVEN